MGYAREFNAENYAIPSFFLTDPTWVDQSWGNDACPCWHNVERKLAVWVECTNPELRELDFSKQFMVVGLRVSDDESITTDDLFATDNEDVLIQWLTLYEVHLHLEGAYTAVNNAIEPVLYDIADELAELLARVSERMSALL